jgi:hypothetical protein
MIISIASPKRKFAGHSLGSSVSPSSSWICSPTGAPFAGGLPPLAPAAGAPVGTDPSNYPVKNCSTLIGKSFTILEGH